MKYKSWSDLTWQKLKSALTAEKEACRKNGQKPLAAFDADGTLWHTDLGENFFRYQIGHCNLPGLPKDPWAHYSSWKSSGDPRPGYLWLAQINAGQKISDVKNWAKKALPEPVPIFSEQKQWIEILHSEGVEVYVVTASVKWAVEPGAALMGIDEDHVLGVETAIIDDMVTNKAHGFMTYREGKASALTATVSGRKPFFCSGNTPGDLALLEISTRERLAVRTTSQPQSDELLEAEEKLQHEAQIRTWMTHQF